MIFIQRLLLHIPYMRQTSTSTSASASAYASRALGSIKQAHMSQYGLLMFVLLITIFQNVVCESEAAGVGRNLEQNNRQDDLESRQFSGGLNANSALNSNFVNSNFGLNQFGNNGGFGISQSTTTRNPNAFNNFNNLIPNRNSNNNNNNNKRKEPNKHTYNNDDKHHKYPGVGYIDRYSHRYPDGSYEYRYELEDGTARYERGYFLLYDNKKTLVVVGYYSYRMPNGRYLTVFYNADRNGYRQNQSITPHSHSNLPRSIDVPEINFKDAEVEETFSKSTTTTTRPRVTTTVRRGGFF